MVALVLAALQAACGGEDPIVVASKNFTEQDILGEIVAQELEARGVPVERRFHLGGTFVCHNALVDGEAVLVLPAATRLFPASLKTENIKGRAGVTHRVVEPSTTDGRAPQIINKISSLPGTCRTTAGSRETRRRN